MCFVSGGLAGSPRSPAGHRSLLALRWLRLQGAGAWERSLHGPAAGKGETSRGPTTWGCGLEHGCREGVGAARHGGLPVALTRMPRAVTAVCRWSG